MKKQDRQQLHNESLQVLQNKLNDAQGSLVKMRFEISINKSKQTAQYNAKRREVARLKTLIATKQSN